MPLYHVTSNTCAKLASRYGLEPGFACAETLQSEALAQHILAGGTRENYNLFEPGELDIARDDFNELLNYFRKPGYPGHDDSVFFWTSLLDARTWADETHGGGNPILEVDAGKVPCQCFVANNRLVEDLFQEVAGNPEYTRDCLNGEDGVYPELKEVCDNLDAMARSYYATMKPYQGGIMRHEEVLCPCDIPADAITYAREPQP